MPEKKPLIRLLVATPDRIVVDEQVVSVRFQQPDGWQGILAHHAPYLTRLVNGNSVFEVHEAAGKAVARARSGGGPSFLECTTYRIRGHAGAGSDAGLGYRTQEEIDSWEKECPVAAFRDRLLSEYAVEQGELELMKADISAEIDEAFAFAQQSNLPKGEDVLKYVFKE